MLRFFFQSSEIYVYSLQIRHVFSYHQKKVCFLHLQWRIKVKISTSWRPWVLYGTTQTSIKFHQTYHFLSYVTTLNFPSSIKSGHGYQYIHGGKYLSKSSQWTSPGNLKFYLTPHSIFSWLFAKKHNNYYLQSLSWILSNNTVKFPK